MNESSINLFNGLIETTVIANGHATNYTNPTAEFSMAIASTALAMDLPVPQYCFAVDSEHLSKRFWLVTVLGSSISTISILENLFLLILFVSHRKYRSSPSFYLLILALSDIFISGTYILIMSVKVLYQYINLVALQRIWVIYLVPMITMSHVAITSSSFLIVFATVERSFVTLSYLSTKVLQNHRKEIALFAVFFGLLTKATILLEIKVVYISECFGTLQEYKLELTQLVESNANYKLWRFWFRNIVTILLPFFSLLYLNARIVCQLRKNIQVQGLSGVAEFKLPDKKQRKAEVRAATRTMVLVACTYLLANVLNVVITIWEHVDASSLFTSFLPFYIISVDASSLLIVIASALRLPIYACCDPMLRHELTSIFTRCLKQHNEIGQLKNRKKLVNSEQQMQLLPRSNQIQL